MDFSLAQATEFANQYTLLHQFPEENAGFSAALFEDRITGKKVLAIRGTDELFNDFVDTNILGIGVSGYADPQVGDLYRYWKQLTTSAGEAVTYTTDKLITLYAL